MKLPIENTCSLQAECHVTLTATKHFLFVMNMILIVQSFYLWCFLVYNLVHHDNIVIFTFIESNHECFVYLDNSDNLRSYNFLNDCILTRIAQSFRFWITFLIEKHMFNNFCYTDNACFSSHRSQIH